MASNANHMVDRLSYHACGGTILHGGTGEQAHSYCDRCRAFAYDSADEPVPDGTDREANRQAWDDGEDTSPAAEVRARWGFECRVRGQWSSEHCGQQDASNTFEAREEAEAELPRLADVLGCDPSDVRVAQIEVL